MDNDIKIGVGVLAFVGIYIATLGGVIFAAGDTTADYLISASLFVFGSIFNLGLLKMQFDGEDRAWAAYNREKGRREELEKYEKIVDSLDMPAESVEFKILENQDVEMQLE
jgi:hypothetical protein